MLRHLPFLPNFLSFIRFPLAFVFLQQNILYRSMALFMAMISDGLDGFLARRYSLKTNFGTLLDPLADKFFVVFVLAIFLEEGRLSWWETAAFICRDFSVFMYGIYLAISGKLFNYRVKAIWCGKLTTFLQFTTLLALTFNFKILPYFYFSFILLGLLALLELYIRPKEVNNP